MTYPLMTYPLMTHPTNTPFQHSRYGLPCKLYIQLIRGIKPEWRSTDTVDAIIQLLMGEIPQYPLYPATKQPIFDNKTDWEKYKSVLHGPKLAETGVGFYDTSKKLGGGMGFSTAPRFEWQSPFSPEEEEAHLRHKESLLAHRDNAGGGARNS